LFGGRRGVGGVCLVGPFYIRNVLDVLEALAAAATRTIPSKKNYLPTSS